MVRARSHETKQRNRTFTPFAHKSQERATSNDEKKKTTPTTSRLDPMNDFHGARAHPHERHSSTMNTKRNKDVAQTARFTRGKAKDKDVVCVCVCVYIARTCSTQLFTMLPPLDSKYRIVRKKSMFTSYGVSVLKNEVISEGIKSMLMVYFRELEFIERHR